MLLLALLMLCWCKWIM